MRSVLHRCCGESPRVKFQRVSSEDCSTPVRGQAVNQSAEIQSAFVFFATAYLFREHSLDSATELTVSCGQVDCQQQQRVSWFRVSE